MKAVLYYSSLPFIYGISLLPFWVLYRLSDLAFVLIYFVLGYRKKVVSQNLRNSFPEKSEAELARIRRKFYRFFCDLMVETLKGLTISPKRLQRRIQFKSTAVFQKYYDQDQSVLIAMGHWGNWELGGLMFALQRLHTLYAIYHPLNNRYFDGLMIRLRTRMGGKVLAMNDTLRGMIRNKKEVTATAFIADQTPSSTASYWLPFLNQDTLFFTGTGKIAHKFKYPVVYAGVKRVKRGRYEIHLEDLVPIPGEMEPEVIVQRFANRLEQDIQEQPEIWLWSHRRWKRKRNTNNQKNPGQH